MAGLSLWQLDMVAASVPAVPRTRIASLAKENTTGLKAELV